MLAQPVNPGWQKPLALIRTLIDRYGFFRNGWVLDAMCGSGTTTHAAILSGMNSFLFDSNDWKVKAALNRAVEWRSQYDQNAELVGKEPQNPNDEEDLIDDDDEGGDGGKGDDVLHDDLLAMAGTEAVDGEEPTGTMCLLVIQFLSSVSNSIVRELKLA